MDAIGDGFKQMFKELPCCLSIRLIQELRDCKFAGSVNAYKEIELPLHRLNFRDIDMKEAPSRACEHALPGSGSGSA